MRCKNCKETFKQTRFNVKYCLEKDECIKAWNDERKANDWKAKKKVLKAKSLTVQDHTKEVQKTFNAYIRKRDEGQPCISCGNNINGVRHASHYISAGSHWNVRFNEDNVWVSCYKCNVMLSGNQIEYRKRLIEKIGIERVEQLEIESAKTRKFTIDELNQINQIYKQKLKEL